MSKLAVALIIVHAAVGSCIAGWLYRQYAVRQAEVARLQAVADAERAETERQQRLLQTAEARRAGLRAGDPFVVELLARERLGWVRPNEVPVAMPPAGPAVDKPRTAP